MSRTASSSYAPLAPILAAAVHSNAPMSPAALEAACAVADTPGLSALRLYARPDLPARLAQDLWDRCLPKGGSAHQWAAARVLRPESVTRTDTVEQVQQLSVDAATGLVNVASSGAAVDPGLLARLTHYPSLTVMTKAAVEAAMHPCAGCREGTECASAEDAEQGCPAAAADAVVDWLGRWALDWFGTDASVLPHAGEEHALVSALGVVGQGPGRLRERAATRWVAPAALARVHAAGLSADALAALVRRYVLPSLPTAGKKLTDRLARVTQDALEVAPHLAGELAEGWKCAPGALERLAFPARLRLLAQFEACGVALTVRARHRPVSYVPSQVAEQLDLFHLIDQHGSPLVWQAVASAAASGTPVTWEDLAAAAVAASTP